VSQYFPPLRDRYARRATVPDSLLLWFHHVPWRDRLGNAVRCGDELVVRYDAASTRYVRCGARGTPWKERSTRAVFAT
jgi:alpha-glucuronidase